MWSTFLGMMIRHAMTGAAGAMVSSGMASADQTQAITGGAIALAAIVMSWIQKQKAKK